MKYRIIDTGWKAKDFSDRKAAAAYCRELKEEKRLQMVVVTK